MSITYGQAGSNGAAGWSVITASLPTGEGTGFSGAGTRKIYVSQSTGNDANPGTLAAPIKTLAHAFQTSPTMVRPGFPDWLLLKRGDTWVDESFGRDNNGFITPMGGRSADEPFLIGAYGVGARPVLRTSLGSAVFKSDFGEASSVDYIAFMSLDCIQYQRDPSDPAYAGAVFGVTAISWLNPSNFLFIEDVRFRFYAGALSITWGADQATQNGLLVCRRVAFDRLWGNPTRGGVGIIGNNITTTRFEDCIWNECAHAPNLDPSWAIPFNENTHNIYWQDNCGRTDFINCFSTNAQYNNIKVRGGANVINCFLARGAQALLDFQHADGLIGWGWSTGGTSVHDNVIAEQRGDAADRFNGLGGGGIQLCPVDVPVGQIPPGPISVRRNLFCNQNCAYPATAIELSTSAKNCVVDSNIIFKWIADIQNSGLFAGTNTITNTKIDLNGDNVEYGFPSPTTALLGKYYQSLGGPDDFDAFMLAACEHLTRDNWDSNYTTPVVNNWFRAKFGMAAVAVDPGDGTPTSHNGGRIQIGADGPATDPAFPYLNAMKSGNQWSFADHTSWDPSLQDSDGYMTSLGGHVGGVEMGIYIPTQAERPGDWLLLWDGGQDGVTTFTLPPSYGLTFVSGSLTGSNGRARVVNSINFCGFSITAVGTPYPRNIRFVHVDDETALANGGIFTQSYLALMRECGVIRFMDTQGINNGGASKWADRKPVTYYSYASPHFIPSLITTAQATNGGSGNAYTLVFPGLALVDKVQVICRFQQTQTAAGTLNVNSTGPKNILDVQGDLIPGISAFTQAGTYSYCIYDLSLDGWIVFNDFSLSSGIHNGAPPEICLQLCIQAGAHPWFNIPYLACDCGSGQLPVLSDYADSLARYCNANQPSWMLPRYETPNETWNTGPGFYATRYAWNKQEKRSGSRSQDQWIGTVGSLIGQAVSAAYGGDRTRYQVVIGFHWATMSPERLTSAYYVSQGGSASRNWATHLCYASYFNSWYHLTVTGQVMNFQWTQAVGAAAKAAIVTSFVDGCVVWDGLETGGYPITRLFAQADQNAIFAASQGVQVTFYEGGYSPDYYNSGAFLRIGSITKGATTTLAVTAGDNTFTKTGYNAAVFGMSVLINDTGLSALNGNSYQVLSATDTTVTINVNSSGMVGTPSGGTMTYNDTSTYGSFAEASKFSPNVKTYEIQNFEYLVNSGATFPSEYQLAGHGYAFPIWDINTYETLVPGVPPRWQAMREFNAGGVITIPVQYRFSSFFM